ncbi:hypothetical protein DRN86_04190, partial [Candidatus Geothermarchaeota archaeon]
MASNHRKLKIIHTADLHLGVALQGMSYEKRERRINDFFKNLEEIVNFAIKNECDFFIIAGDIFSNPLPRGEIFNKFSYLIGRLVERNIKVVAVAGNHDTPPNLIQRNTTLGLQLAGIRNFKYIDYRSKPEPLLLEGYYSKRRIIFYAIPFIYPEAISEGERSIVEYEKRIYDLFDEQLSNSMNIEDVDYRMAIAHLTVEGAKYSEKVEPTYTYELKVRKSFLNHLVKLGDIDYFALGHIHLHQDINSKASYSGSIERINFGEMSDEKGCIFIYEDKGGLTREFIRL